VLRNVLTAVPATAKAPAGGVSAAVSLLQRAKQTADEREETT